MFCESLSPVSNTAALLLLLYKHRQTAYSFTHRHTNIMLLLIHFQPFISTTWHPLILDLVDPTTPQTQRVEPFLSFA